MTSNQQTDPTIEAVKSTYKKEYKYISNRGIASTWMDTKKTNDHDKQSANDFKSLAAIKVLNLYREPNKR